MQGAGLKEYSLYFEVPQRRSRGRIGRKAPRGFMRCALALCALGLAALSAGLGSAQQPGARDGAQAQLRIAPPATLTAGTPALIEVYVRLPPGPEQPVLLTPRSEGAAVRVTRGRLLRADAQLTADGELRFLVPVAVTGAGTAVLHVDLLTYHCARKCEAVRATASRTLQAVAR